MDEIEERSFEALARIYEEDLHPDTVKHKNHSNPRAEDSPAAEAETEFAPRNAPKKEKEPVYTGYTIVSDLQIVFYCAVARKSLRYVSPSRGIGTMIPVSVLQEEFTADHIKKNMNNEYDLNKMHPDDKALFQKAYEQLFPFRF